MYNALRDEAWNEFDKKTGFEWRMSFGIWAALAAATALCIKENEALSKTELHQYLIPAILVIIILHLIFLSWVQFTHRLNRDRQQFWSRKMASLAIPAAEDRLPEPEKTLKRSILINYGASCCSYDSDSYYHRPFDGSVYCSR
jgi:hypothetical protein